MLNIAIPDSLESGIPNEPKNVWKQETACTRVFQSHKHIAWCSFLRFEKSQGILWKWQVYFHAMCSIHCTLNKLLWGGKAVFLDLQGTPELWYVLFDTVNCESSSHVEKAKAKKKINAECDIDFGGEPCPESILTSRILTVSLDSTENWL